tara:strand:- start:4344 stop:5492 length:1149 start_codon:yes stop_codon:yes gene_type:complete
MEALDLSKCVTNEEVSISIRAHVRSYDLGELTEKLSSRFVFQEEAIRKIYVALTLGKNAILHGPGGFGKSEIVKAVCGELGVPIICKVGYQDMMPEELLGIPNMGKLLNESKYETAFENSVFCTPGILVLEEFFDCDPSTAAALKDVLTERGMREGSTKKESLISSVIITGNKDPQELGVDDSTKAFYLERFPYQHEAIWPSYDEKDYMKFYKVFYGTTYGANKKKLLLCSKLCSSTEGRISPRTAGDAGDTAIGLGVEFLDTINALDTTMLRDVIRSVEQESAFLEEEELLIKVKEAVKDTAATIVTNSLLQLESDKRFLSSALEELAEQEFSNETMELYYEVTGLIKFGIDQVDTEISKKLDTKVIISKIKKIFYDTDDA